MGCLDLGSDVSVRLLYRRDMIEVYVNDYLLAVTLLPGSATGRMGVLVNAHATSVANITRCRLLLPGQAVWPVTPPPPSPAPPTPVPKSDVAVQGKASCSGAYSSKYVCAKGKPTLPCHCRPQTRHVCIAYGSASATVSWMFAENAVCLCILTLLFSLCCCHANQNALELGECLHHCCLSCGGVAPWSEWCMTCTSMIRGIRSWRLSSLAGNDGVLSTRWSSELPYDGSSRCA